MFIIIIGSLLVTFSIFVSLSTSKTTYQSHESYYRESSQEGDAGTSSFKPSIIRSIR